MHVTNIPDRQATWKQQRQTCVSLLVSFSESTFFSHSLNQYYSLFNLSVLSLFSVCQEKHFLVPFVTEIEVKVFTGCFGSQCEVKTALEVFHLNKNKILGRTHPTAYPYPTSATPPDICSKQHNGCQTVRAANIDRPTDSAQCSRLWL